MAARLLESDMDFYNILQTSEGNLTVEGATNSWKTNSQGAGAYDEAVGQLEVWWGVEFEARSWGIKDIVPFVKKLKLDGWFEYADDSGDMVDSGERFHYEYPEQRAAAPEQKIGPDVDAPTPANVYRLADPKWEVETEVDRQSNNRTTFVPQAEVDLNRHKIKITF